jgi:hypothetical protein
MNESKCLWDLQHIEKMMQEHDAKLKAKKEAFASEIEKLTGGNVSGSENALWDLFLTFEKIHND